MPYMHKGNISAYIFPGHQHGDEDNHKAHCPRTCKPTYMLQDYFTVWVLACCVIYSKQTNYEGLTYKRERRQHDGVTLKNQFFLMLSFS